MVRKAEKKGVETKIIEFNDDLIKGSKRSTMNPRSEKENLLNIITKIGYAKE